MEPQNIVAIPTDYHNSKIRCCEYTPLEEYTYEQGEIQDVLYNIARDNRLNKASTELEEDYYESAITNDWPEDDLEDDDDYYDNYFYEDDEKEDD